MREIILDTETTGLDPAQGHRIVEIGAIELVNHIPSGKRYHVYIDPGRDMPAEAEAVHGLSTAFLKGKPLFAAVVDELLDFIADAPLVMHNANFDLGFLNWELAAVKRAQLPPERIVDTLMLARKRHPMGPNSLDALCKRYGIDNSRRDKHGALLDAELLAEVYVELTGGRQTALTLATSISAARRAQMRQGVTLVRERPLQPRVSEGERDAHAKLIAEIGEKAIWLRWSN
ncbi:MAG: DNA polymerase III subunit epsilon [Rhizobiales bacterium]|nr:DNA polymerase III subunit epsilon [Hyphomicrobiales bacterium]